MSSESIAIQMKASITEGLDVGNNNYVNQDVSQTGTGSQTTQSGANALAVLGDNNYVDQQVTQMAYGQNIFQNG